MRSHRRAWQRGASAHIPTRLPWFIVVCLALTLVTWGVFSYQRSKLLRLDRVTLVLGSNPPAVLSLNRNSGEVNLLFIPSDTYIEVPGNFGKYRAGTIWNLGIIENRGGLLLLSAMQSFLGAPISGWIGWLHPTTIDFTDKRKDELLKMLQASFSPLLSGNRLTVSNLSAIEKLWLWWHLKRLSGEKLAVINLQDKGVLLSIELPDGSQALTGDPELVDKVSQTLYFEERIKNDAFVLRIHNSSDISGMGNKIARLLTNIGYHVISVENSDRRFQRCHLEIPTVVAARPSVKRLEQIFPCDFEFFEPELKDEDSGALYITSDLAALW